MNCNKGSLSILSLLITIMDLSQKKLTRAEWLNIEIQVSDEEQRVLDLIVEGYHDVNLKKNFHKTIVHEMKLNDVTNIHEYLYIHYFGPLTNPLISKYGSVFEGFQINIKKSQKTLRKVEMLKINNMNDKINSSKNTIFEFVLLKFADSLLSTHERKSPEYAFHLYTLMHILQYQIRDINIYVKKFIQHIIQYFRNHLNIHDVLSKAYEFIEKNKYLLKYADLELFEHQKRIFQLFKSDPVSPKLVLYTAPTGTGKTLTPLGLSEGHRIIFICAARHIGLALAKSAISVNKPIGIAFGCDNEADIRLHYYAAATYSKNKKSGGIGKVDNSDGSRVRIMICDVQSYQIAMNYMVRFSSLHNYQGNEEEEEYDSDDDDENKVSAVRNRKYKKEQEARKYLKDCILEDDDLHNDNDIITYWDEPTISMDYDNHPLHDIIHSTWKDNRISKLVLSCATLPHEEEINETLMDFRMKFEDATIHNINSYDCRKSISLLLSDGKCLLPHLLYNNYDEMLVSYSHIKKNKSLLRYLDLQEIIRFIQLVHITDQALPDEFRLEHYFEEGIEKITMNNLKIYYLELLSKVNPDHYETIYTQLKENQINKFEDPSLRKQRSLQENSSVFRAGGGKLTKTVSMVGQPELDNRFNGILLTTKDAHTLTDGPTIYLAENLENLAKFYVHKSNIPEQNLNMIMKNIESNNHVQKKITTLEQNIEEKLNKSTNNDDDGNGKKSKSSNSKMSNRDNESGEIRRLQTSLEELKQHIQVCQLEGAYIPNTIDHQYRWLNSRIVENAFQPRIDEENVEEIMMLDVTNEMKMLLLMGIGMFVKETNANPRYLEIIKKLAYEQKLFLILACSDYIYGTNYQFCHGFIGKDLLSMTQQKTIQALGRIGRNQSQQEYTVRFRDDMMVKQLFHPSVENKEADIMNHLFCSSA